MRSDVEGRDWHESTKQVSVPSKKTKIEAVWPKADRKFCLFGLNFSNRPVVCPAPKVNKRGMWRVSDIWSIIPSLAVRSRDNKLIGRGREKDFPVPPDDLLSLSGSRQGTRVTARRTRCRHPITELVEIMGGRTEGNLRVRTCLGVACTHTR